MVANLCVHCWIIGMSGTLEEMTRTNVAAKELIFSAKKLGEYFSGTCRLYFLFGDKSMRMSLASFEVFAVPSTSDRKVQLCEDWYRVIETIYLRVMGEAIGITRAKLYSHLQSAITAYVEFDRRFIRHAEIDLIKYLMSQNLPPTVIGISKLSCALCNTWIATINNGNMMKWKVSGCHGRIYDWARDVNAGSTTAAAEASVKAFVYRQLVDLVTKFIPDGGESPAHPSTFDGDTGFKGFVKLRR